MHRSRGMHNLPLGLSTVVCNRNRFSWREELGADRDFR
jgi:hypothetical protein